MSDPEQLNKLIKELTRDEGYRQHPYQDTVGKLTVGIGRNLDDVGITRQEAEFLAKQDILRAAVELDSNLPWWESTGPVRQRALLNMCFNLGITRLLGFKKMLAALEDGRWADAASEAMDSKWARQVGARAGRIATMLEEGDGYDA